MGNKYTVEKTYYNTFPSLKLILQQYNMTFALNKEDLFFDKYGKTYFLIIFKKSGSQNNIWKLGEPFFSKYQFTFDMDKKTVGFYNKNFKNEYDEQTKSSSGMTVLYIIILFIIVGVLVAAAYYFGKKFNESRKKRANELNDDFDYSSGNKLNSNNTPQVNDGSLGL
jgi:hypothetical protein